MSECIRQLCFLAVLFGVILDITPEGNAKRVSSMVCSAALIMTLFSAVKSLELPEYGFESAYYRELGNSLATCAKDRSEQLGGLVIQSKCEEYIMDKAAQLGITEIGVGVEVYLSDNDEWLPESVMLTAQCSDDAREQLSNIIETELGIVKGNQIWNN